jgi:hypothetical protein
MVLDANGHLLETTVSKQLNWGCRVKKNFQSRRKRVPFSRRTGGRGRAHASHRAACWRGEPGPGSGSPRSRDSGHEGHASSARRRRPGPPVR